AQEKELAQAREIEEAYENLKSAQDQLVQQEKLASLGQLTAGIAHEIKNPLNFVNNFSDLSLELVEEVRDEIRDMRRETTGERSNVKGETEESPLEGSAEEERRRGVPDEATDDTIDSDLILDILDDIEANLKTIYKHGSRADSIVKSMLQHSRGGDGKMEPTPLNPLIKEYVNLAFHGMRAGDDPINVDIDLQLDKAVGEVPLVAEDFSRVIVNLSNNGFDAMREKESSPLEGSGGAERSRGVSTESSYQPKLTVRTFRNENTVTIEIEDNGPGIPDEMKDKIMQPFFTTKKGTQGTGLGLSITNDIVKAHGGSIDIKAEEGNGSVFVISLPTGSIYDSEKKN
ncbi:MAG TPA: ATP-binding protein, partial [Balneolaceae bacterium]|nr:ATP-binding protein [Balneolaceae bacterium]